MKHSYARSLFALALAFFFVTADTAQAGRFCHCEVVDDYKPAKGVLKLWTVSIKTEWEHRHHCLPGGRKLPYKVKVITYRERYTDGVQRTWKCVVAGSEVTLGK
jgi:hypothetical protein